MSLEFLKPVSVRSAVNSISLRNTLVRNTLLLAAVQASHYVLVLVTMPYLTRVLGVEQFGLLGITSEIIANLMAFTDWGFGLSAIRDVARNSRDPVELRRIVGHDGSESAARACKPWRDFHHHSFRWFWVF